jgi:hypothetical protein
MCPSDSIQCIVADIYRSKMKEKNPRQHKGLQTRFYGNYSTMRTHISRGGMDHYSVYRGNCLAENIDMSESAVPPAENERRKNAGNRCVTASRGYTALSHSHHSMQSQANIHQRLQARQEGTMG